LLIGVVTLALKFYNLKFKAIGFGDFKFNYLKLGLLAFAVYLPLSILFLAGMSQLFPINVDEAREVGFENLVGIEMILTFLVLVILTPIAEELLFRGLVFTGFRNKLPFWIAAVLVSLLFAFAHWQPNVALDVFVMSLICCYIREKSGSLWPSILLHVFKNGLAFLLLFVFKVAA
jgi:membrane protease YdiL (CAAX protease family)